MTAPSSHPLRLFSFERRWLVAIAEDLIPSGESELVPLGARDVPLRRYVDDLLWHAPLEFVMGLRLCLWLVLLCPPIVLRRFSTYFGLSPDERLRVHDRLRESPIYLFREMPLLFKMVGCLGFCGLPEVQAAIGIEPRDREPPEWAA